MAKTPLPTHDSPSDPETELLARVDDSITEALHGAAARPPQDPGTHVRPEQVDLLLRLHQLGAAWRETTDGEPATQPTRIDRFEIGRAVGQGGFATVYEATDTLLGRRVALKVPHPEALVSPGMRRRFLRAAELAARLTHPNLVTMYDLGESGGVTFIAEEFCSGGTLAEWLERHPGPVEPRTAALVVKHLAEGLDVAHAGGIIHRDVKPENVLLVPAAAGAVLPPDDGPNGGPSGAKPASGFDVKLGDFGLGRIDDDATPDPLSRLTRAGGPVGTVAWAAPEQIDRRVGPIGFPTDVHALGLLLDRLLTGRCRWVGTTDSETMRLILQRESEDVDRASVGVPRDLAAVCRTCLDKQPERRYPRAGDLAADLSRYLLGVPTRVRPLSLWERGCRFAIRRPAVVAATAVALLACLVSGLALWGWSIQSAAAAREHDQVQRMDAAQHLQRGLDELRAGNVAAARERITGAAALDPALDASFAGRWARRRLRSEHAILFGDPDAPVAASGPPRALYCVAVSPDGLRIAVGAADGRLILLDADGAAVPVVVAGAHDEVNDVAFSPDGRVVATAGQDGRVRVWSAATGVAERDLARETAPLFAVCWSPDGARLAWGGEERVLCVGRIDGTPAARFSVAFTLDPGYDSPDIETATFLDDDAIAIAGGRQIMLLRSADGSLIREWVGHLGAIVSLDVSPDGTRLLSAGHDRVPRVWDIASGDLVCELPLHPLWVQGCVFTADGTRIVSGCRDGVLQVFDAASGELLCRLPGHVDGTWDVRREPGGTVLSTGADGTVRRFVPRRASVLTTATEWSLPTGLIDRGLPFMSRDELVAGGPGAALRVVVVPRSEGARIIDGRNGRTLEVLEPPADPKVITLHSALDRHRDRLAVFESNYDLRLIPLCGRGAVEPHVDRSWIRIDWTADGLTLAATTHAPSTIVARDETGQETVLDRIDAHCNAFSLSPDGSLLAAGGRALLGITPLTRQGAPRPARPTRSYGLEPSFGSLFTLAWSPDKTRLAIGSQQGNVRVLDAATGTTLRVMPSHRNAIHSLVWSADGRTVISSDDEAVRICDSATMVAIDTIIPGWAVRSAALAGPPDAPERWLVVAGDSPHALPTAEGASGRGRLLVVDLGR
jgi:serine/threonine protein kinase/WD40 repeat protein